MMIHRSFRSEMTKLRRRSFLLPFIGIGLILSCVITYVIWRATPSISPDGAVLDAGSSQLPIALAAFSASDGLGATWRFLSPQLTMITFIATVVVAGTEYRHSTWKNLIVRSSSRTGLLLGRATAILLVVAGAAALWGIGSMLTSAATAYQLDIATDRWFSADGIVDNAVILVSAIAGQCITAIFALGLTTILRSPVTALVVGLCWGGVCEPVVAAFAGERFAGVAAWLPNQAVKELIWQPAFWSVVHATTAATAVLALAWFLFRRWEPRFS